MLVFRFACAILMAWAINWCLARPEAAFLIEEVDEMIYIGPLAGALTGFFMLWKRQGNGVLIGTANGVWIGLLTIALAAGMYLAAEMWGVVAQGLIKDFEHFMRALSAASKPLIETMTAFWLFGITLAATAVVGLATELLRWCLRWARKARGEEEPKQEVRSGVAKAGGALS